VPRQPGHCQTCHVMRRRRKRGIDRSLCCAEIAITGLLLAPAETISDLRQCRLRCRLFRAAGRLSATTTNFVLNNSCARIYNACLCVYVYIAKRLSAPRRNVLYGSIVPLSKEITVENFLHSILR